MARRFGRRKPKVVWLPVFGRDFSNVPETTSFGNGVGGTFTVQNTGVIATDFQAVTFDYSDQSSLEEGTDFRSLHNLVSGNNYRLRRLVGKVHAAAVCENNDNGFLPTLDVAAGFIINRTDPDGNPVVNSSLGSPQEVFGPLSEDSAEDPWIWRRRWLLGTYPAAGSFPITTDNNLNDFNNFIGFQGQWPQTTAGYGSVQDGPHVDQKTARVIGTQERLFFWIQARVTNPASGTNNGTIVYQVDLRILASLRMGQGNRRNASR